MEVKFNIKLPINRGKIVEDYLKVLKENTKYSAWTINDDLEVVPCDGIIRNNESWNYHNNYDNSESELYVVIGDRNRTYLNRWFSLNKDEVIKVQQENIINYKNMLYNEILRLDELTNKE